MDKHIMAMIEASGLWSVTNDEPYFSWYGCEHPNCDEKGKGSTVYDCKGYTCLEEARNNVDNYYEFKVCPECLSKMANGD